MTKEDLKFISPSKGEMGMLTVVSEISDFVNKSPESFYTLVIGSDSQTRKVNGVAEIDFVTAVIIHRESHGARYFYRKETRFLRPVLRDKIYTETLMSLSTAQEMLPMLNEVMTNAAYELEIHIDVGQVGQTREMIKEVVGMVNGYGFIARTKPRSWGASSVADHHTRTRYSHI